MIFSRRAALNGAQLDEVHDAVVIRSIEPAAGKDTITAAGNGGPYGQRITGGRRDSIDIVIKFALDIRRTDLQGRSEALEAVNAWAAAACRENGGAWLTVGHRPDRRIRVVLAQAAQEGDLWQWTEDFQLTFRAYGVPYWENVNAASSAIGGESLGATGMIEVGGSAPASAGVTMENTSGAALNTVTVSVNGKQMAFTSLALAAGESLIIDHDDATGLLRIRIQSPLGGYRSAMDKRTPESADDFIVPPGAHPIGYSAQRACRMTVEWRERYL